MFLDLVRHEVQTRLRELWTHIYFFIFFAFAFLAMLALGGAFGGGNLTLLGMGPNTNINSPFALGFLTFLISFLGVLITAPFMGRAVYRDYDSGIHPLTFTTPVSEGTYLSGRFVGSLIVHLYLYLGITFGFMLGTHMPWVEASRLGAFSLAAYFQPYLIFILPNLLFTGALFFALPALTRRMLPNYIGGILLFMSYNIASLLMEADALTNSTIAALLDPFGQIPAADVTRYWTVAEQNSQLIPLEGTFLFNRLLFVGVGLLILVGLYAQFRFRHLPGTDTSGGDATDESSSLAELSPTSVVRSLDLPHVRLSNTWTMRWKQFWTLTKRSFAEIVRDVYFYAIVMAGVIFLVVAADQADQMFGTPVYPVTYHILDALSQNFLLFMWILIAFYAGQLVWRERDVGADQFHDAMPLPTSLSMVAKGTALVLMSAVLMGVILGAGVLTQWTYGFTDIDWGLYVVELFGVQLLDYALLCGLALAVHALVNQKYIGHFVIIAYFVLRLFSGQLGLEHNLYWFGATPGMPYSDMNGYGHFAWGWLWHMALWSSVTVLLAVGARLLWPRGVETRLVRRFKQARNRLSPALLGTTGGAFLLALAFGGYVYVNTTVWNTFRTSNEQEVLQAEYEKTYERFQDQPQPRVTAADLDVDLYPERRDAHFAGTYELVNDRAAPVDTLFLGLSSELDVEALTLARRAEVVRSDETHGVRLLRLENPLAPGDTAQLSFDVWQRNRGFTNDGDQTSVVYNGTFVNSAILPSVGYNEGGELTDNDTREEHGLEPEPRTAPLSDSTARMRPYIGQDATWLRYEATVSTADDQTALAPGTLDSTWTTDGRRHFHYETNAPTANFFSFLSARYDVVQDTWEPENASQNDGEPVQVEVYYHPEHDYNVDRMVEAVKHSLSYYTDHFGPYQSDQVRIAEFPRYATFAQSFLGTIPYSESIGFIARVNSEEDIDYPYYITAHELAHQWWGHQIASGDMQGGTMLVETLAQYSALMVMEEAYGPKHMKRFLDYELDQYLIGRSQEQRAEQPLMRVENQNYIHYRKGSLVMYALKDYLGEATVNQVLRDFVADYKFTEPPFPTSEMLVERFEAAAPDSLEGFVGDLFREITLYENRATEATYTETDDGQYRVDLTVEAKKLQADSLGTETPVEMGDYVDIGVFANDADVGTEEQEVLYLQKHSLTDGEQTVTVTVDEEPAQAGVDPYVKLVDRNTDDNVTEVSEGEGEAEEAGE